MGIVINGSITKIESKNYYLIPDGQSEEILCSLRGIFKKKYAMKKEKLFFTDFITVGDDVEFDFNNDGTGVITKIKQRRNQISRKLPKDRGASYRGERLEQVIAANINNVVIITSVHLPDFNSRVLDRFLVAAESSHLRIILVINKCDLDKSGIAKNWAELYQAIGYKIILTSVENNEGILSLNHEIQNSKNLFWGHSGVGKSSLLNKMFPDLKLRVGGISKFTSKGTHTTVTAVMKKVEDNTFIIDTPGLREIDPYGIRKSDLGHYFLEFAKHSERCKFNTCTHHHEPECAVIEAVEKEIINPVRYDSYLRLLDTIEDDINF